ncbi:MAG: ornithine carbamoyltransferase [SAR324 cluster bacterium]|nr:ornithine carbamoyltransferase [SAR324 cluster bacterium]
MTKHLIDWKFWEKQEIINLMELAVKVKKCRWDYQGLMNGNSLAMIFQKTSTRTRISFEACMAEMGGHSIYMDWLTSNFMLSSIRLETKYICRNVAFIVTRFKDNKDLLEMASASEVPVINGCCNLYHPCQALTDLLTIKLDCGYLEGVNLTYVGVYNNVVNSLVSICGAFKVNLTLVCPIKDASITDEESYQKLIKQGLLHETLDLQEAVAKADYVYTDTWMDMEFFNDPAFAKQKKNRVSLMEPYQLNHQTLKNSSAKVMHDMPIHLGYEISEALVEDDKRSIIFDQAENRLEAQKALLIYLKGRKSF